MAKKKSTAAAAAANNDRPELLNKSAENDETMEKVRNLKSLNAVLVKQAHEMRVERSTLIAVNKVLEERNVRLAVEKDEVEDVAVKMEVEKDVMAAVVVGGVGEMLKWGEKLVDAKEGVERRLEVVEREVEVLRGEKESVVRNLVDLEKERDVLNKEVVVRSMEVSVLKEKAVERESEVGKVLDELRKENEAAVREKIDRNAIIAKLEDDNYSMIMSFGKVSKDSENLRKQVDNLVKEKCVVESERNEKELMVEGLEKEVCSLRETVMGLEAEVDMLQKMVSELENGNAELAKQKDGLSFEFAILKELNEGKEEQIRSLLLEKEMLTLNVEETASDLEKSKRESERVIALLHNEIVELNQLHKIEVGEMQEMAFQLKIKLESAQQSCETQMEEKKKLATELENLRAELEGSIAENVRAQTDIQLEKKNVQILTKNLVELETRIQESAKEILQLGNEKSKLIEAKKAVETQVELLEKEKDLLQEKLEEAEKESMKARANIEIASSLSDNVLHILKKTTKEVHASSDLLGVEEQPTIKQSVGVEPFMSEMDAIRNAFKSREVTLNDMRKELELMKHSVAEAQKRKSLWQLVTSAAAIFAAASVAYVSRGH